MAQVGLGRKSFAAADWATSLDFLSASMIVSPVCAGGGRRLVAQALAACGSYPKKIESATSWPRVREPQKPGVNSRWLRSEERFLSGFSDGKNKKEYLFSKTNRRGY